MKMMVQNMNKGEPMPMLDLAFDAAKSAGIVMTLFSDSYDGGEFCRGLLFSKEASKVVYKIGNMMMAPSDEKKITNSKKLALESRLQ